MTVQDPCQFVYQQIAALKTVICLLLKFLHKFTVQYQCRSRPMSIHVKNYQQIAALKTLKSLLLKFLHKFTV
jgi:membrane-bound inhibitor of C-type lysozyme